MDSAEMIGEIVLFFSMFAFGWGITEGIFPKNKK